MTNIIIFHISSSNTMFEASSVYFQCVNEQAAQVEIDRVSVGVDLGHGKSPFLIIRSLSTTGVL